MDIRAYDQMIHPAKPPSQRTRRPPALAAAAGAALRRHRHQPSRTRLGVAISGSRPTTRTQCAALLGGGSVSVTVAELWARGKKRVGSRTPLLDPMRQNERRAQNRPTMLSGALRREPSPLCTPRLSPIDSSPAKFPPPALTPSLSLPPRSFARGEGEIVLVVRALIEI